MRILFFALLAPYAGVPNSHIEGNNVMVYTLGNVSMKTVFAFPNPHHDVDQDVTKYVELEGFSISCGNGTITVLDPLDDVLMQHGVSFDDGHIEVKGKKSKDTHDGEETDLRYRVAFVMRWLRNEEEFYTDTSTVRLTDDMKRAMQKSNANNRFDGKGRDIYS